MRLPIEYKGFVIARSDKSGGKAGTGKNRTATLQVREPMARGSYLLKHQFRYTVDSLPELEAAFQKAKTWIDDFVLS